MGDARAKSLGRNPVATGEVGAANKNARGRGNSRKRLSPLMRTRAGSVTGWRWKRLAQFKNEADRRVLGRAIRVVYLPWLEESARHFQDLFRKHAAEARKAVGVVKGEKETCLLIRRWAPV